MRRPQDWGHACPNPECARFKLMNTGNVSAISTYMTKSGKRRIFRCRDCATAFSETRDTVFFDLRTPEEKVIMALKMLLVGVDLTGIAFVLGVTEETTLEWLARAAAKARQINDSLLRELPVTQVQLDEMWNFIRRKHASEDGDGESLPEAADGRQWVWISFAPEYRLMLTAVVGPRTLETAKEVIEATAAIVRGVPAFFSDGFTCYFAALIAVYHTITIFPRTGKPGRPKDPRIEPHPELVYGQLVKEKRQGQAGDPQHAHPRRRRAPDRAWPLGEHGPDREAEPDLAPGAGAACAQDLQLLQRARADAAPSALLPGVL